MEKRGAMTEEAKFWQGRQVALTGATGFLGLHTARLLRKRGAAVTALVRGSSSRERLQALDVRCAVAPLDDVLSLMSGCTGADVLIHLAGAVDFGDGWELCRKVNVEGTRNVLQAARMAGVRRVVHVSSIVAVGARRDGHPLDESAHWNLGRYEVPYVTTKRQAEQLAVAANAPGLDVVAVNPGCVVGPDDFTGSEFGTLCRRFWRGRVPFYFAGGLSVVDVRDVAAGILAAARAGLAGRRYLLSGHNLTQGAFFGELARVAGGFYPRLRLPCFVGRRGAAVAEWLLKPRRRPYLSSGQARMLGLHFWYDHTRARRELGFAPRPLSETLSDTHVFWTRHRAR
jgi:dihydroflavonol-4-reductase